MNKFDEQVLVVERSKFLHEALHGFKPIEQFQNELWDMLHNIEVKRRGDVENDPTYKQLISYVVVQNDKGETLVYTRLKGGGEIRLHGSSSVGIGGHMNPVEDAEGHVLLFENTYRELEEEIGVLPDDLRLIGVINDDTNEVGQVHIGLVYLANIGDQDIYITETDTLEVEFTNRFNGYHFETWSQLLKEAHVI